MWRLQARAFPRNREFRIFAGLTECGHQATHGETGYVRGVRQAPHRRVTPATFVVTLRQMDIKPQVGQGVKRFPNEWERGDGRLPPKDQAKDI